MREPTHGAEPPHEAGASHGGDSRATTLLGGRYRLVTEIASGGMASVWRAHDELLDRTVAVKVLHDHLATDDEFRERFRREAVAAARLTHPHIVAVYDTGGEGSLAWLVMELVAGATLRDVMDAHGPLPVARAAAIGEKVARGLAYAHEQGLVHRDVKPANILLDDGTAVKVADFGIAKAEGSERDLTGSGTVLGTASYVAPEQILSEPLDGACDQYALGCVLFEALTGRRPFTGASAMETAAQRLRADPPPVRSLRPDVPAGLAAAVERALARRPADRFPTAADFADALAPFAGAGHTLVLPAAGPTPLVRPPAASAPPLRAAVGPGTRPAGPGTRPAGRRAPAPPPRPRPRAASGPPRPPTPAGGPPPPPRPSPAPRQAPRTPTTPAAGRRRWAVPLIGTFVVAGMVLMGLATGVVDVNPADPQADTEAGGALVAPTAVNLFDPGGTGSEDRADLPAILDGDASTGWRSVGYNSPDFGGLKSGLGFWLDFGAPHAVTGVALRTATPGISYEIRTADAPATDLAGWQPVGGRADATDLSQVDFDAPAVTRYLLVWITGDLQPDGSGRYRAEVSEVAVIGQRA